MEPVTYVANRQSTKLQHPQKWKDGTGIKDFLGATQHESLETLQNVSESSEQLETIWLT